jgi:hypothetical protein
MLEFGENPKDFPATLYQQVFDFEAMSAKVGDLLGDKASKQRS